MVTFVLGSVFSFSTRLVTTVGDIDGAGYGLVCRHTVWVVEARERQHGLLLGAVVLAATFTTRLLPASAT